MWSAWSVPRSTAETHNSPSTGDQKRTFSCQLLDSAEISGSRLRMSTAAWRCRRAWPSLEAVRPSAESTGPNRGFPATARYRGRGQDPCPATAGLSTAARHPAIGGRDDRPLGDETTSSPSSDAGQMASTHPLRASDGCGQRGCGPSRDARRALPGSRQQGSGRAVGTTARCGYVPSRSAGLTRMAGLERPLSVATCCRCSRPYGCC